MPNEDFFNQAKWQVESEQLEAGMQHQARVFGGYYAALVAAGVPPDLASALVRDAHALMWKRGLWPTAPPGL